VKILYVGQLAEGQTCRMRMDELAHLGHDIVSFNTQDGWQQVSWLGKHFQSRMRLGPVINEINQTILSLAKMHRPDVFWGDKQEYLRPETLIAMRDLGIKSLHFTPDPYFTLRWKRTKLSDACMPLFDIVITSKSYEVEAYQRACRKVVYMPLGFSELHHRVMDNIHTRDGGKFSTDIGFIGGWEPRRERMLEAIASEGMKTRIWGYAWDHLIDGKWSLRRWYRLRMNAGRDSFRIRRSDVLAPCISGSEIYGDNYAQALTGAKISIGFLRLVCPDQHTTRTFEIPACGSMLLADRTSEHCEFFEEGKEAEFFSSQEELVEKAKYYSLHSDERQAIANAGRKRCIESGYSYRERLAKVINEVF
jgi:spore maturation protein CgeB